MPRLSPIRTLLRSAFFAAALLPSVHAGLAPAPLVLTVGNTVNCDHATIQSAINAAPGAGSTIVRISNNVGHTNQALTIANKNIELRGGYPGCDLAPASPDSRTTLRGDGGSSVILVDAVGNPRTVVLRNLVIREGGSSDVLTERGGGVRIQGASRVEIRNTRISDNQSHDGGGIHIQGSDAELLLDDGTIIGEAGGIPGNRALDNGITQARGGGLSCSGADVEIIDARFRLNTSQRNGGGMHVRACTTRISPRADFVTGENGANGFVTFFENQAGQDGGAIYADDGNLLWFAFDGESFAGRATGNIAANSGGAFYLTGNAMNFATFWVRLEGNGAENTGGAVAIQDQASFVFGPSPNRNCNYSTCPAIIDSGLDGAPAPVAGGAIYVADGGSAGVLRAIIARNSAISGSAIFAGSEGTALVLRHALVQQNFLSQLNNTDSPITVLGGADADLIHVTMTGNVRPGGLLFEAPLSSVLISGNGTSVNLRNSIFTDDGVVTVRNLGMTPGVVLGTCSLSHENSSAPGLVIGEPNYSNPGGATPSFVLAPGSDGIDRCATVETFPMTPLPDLFGRERPFDVATASNDEGPWDMGAFESYILSVADIFEDGFEEFDPF
jgi:predicted outer membrane repeat protein